MLDAGYGKIFKSIYSGTLADNWKALVTFQQMIVLCDPNGVVDMTPQMLHRVTGIPLDILEEGIAVLESPDSRSRSNLDDGRRIVRLDDHRDWGWSIVNHFHYRDLSSKQETREQTRERVRKFREKNKNVNGNENVTDGNGGGVTVTDGNACNDTHTHTQTQEHIPSLREGVGSKLPPCPQHEIIKLYHELLPMCPTVRVWTKHRAGFLRARWKEHSDLDWWKKFFLYVAQSKFLTGGAGASADRGPFLADLEWLLRPSNFAKVVEGKYHKANKRTAPA